MSDDNTPPPKRLPTFEPLRLRDDAAYCELVAMLADSAQRVEEGAEALAEAGYCVQAVIVFLRRDPAATAAILPGPLTILNNAIHDLEQGANPALFAKRSLEGRPTNLVARDLIKAWVAAAFDKLLQAKVSNDEAANWTVRECHRLGILYSKEAITPKRVVRWRKDLQSEQLAANQAVDLFKRLRYGNQAIKDPWDQARIILETYVGFMMEPKRRDTPPLSDSDDIASS